MFDNEMDQLTWELSHKMPDNKVSAEVVYELLNQLRTDVREQHSRLRMDMNAGFDNFREDRRVNAEEQVDINNRLIEIEAIIRERRDVTHTRLLLLVSIISVGITIIWQIVQHAMGWIKG